MQYTEWLLAWSSLSICISNIITCILVAVPAILSSPGFLFCFLYHFQEILQYIEWLLTWKFYFYMHFLTISCLSLWQNIFGNNLKGASFFASKYALSNISFLSARPFLLVSATSWIVLYWPACSYKYFSFSLQSLSFKPWLSKCLSNAALWGMPLAWSVAELCWSVTLLSEVHETPW